MAGGHGHHPALKRYVAEVLDALQSSPKTFLQLRKELGKPPQVTLSQTLRELRSYRLIEPYTYREGDKAWKRYRLTAKGQRLLPDLQEFVRKASEIEERFRQ